MRGMPNGTYLATSGGNMTCLTGPGYFIGCLLYASAAAATITIADSGGNIISWSGAAAATLNIQPPVPIAVSKLTATNSGAGTYVVFFATQ